MCYASQRRHDGCVCVCVCVQARMGVEVKERVCMRVCVSHKMIHYFNINILIIVTKTTT